MQHAAAVAPTRPSRYRYHCRRFQVGNFRAIPSVEEEDHRHCSCREACEDWAYAEGAVHPVRSAAASAGPEVHTGHAAAVADRSNLP